MHTSLAIFAMLLAVAASRYNNILLSSLAKFEFWESSSMSLSDHTVVVFFPFTFAEVDSVQHAVTTRWFRNIYDESESFEPCSGQFKQHMSLVLGFHKNAQNGQYKDTLDALLEKTQNSLSDCFDTISLISYNLTSFEDTHPGGVSTMVFRTLLEPESYFVVNTRHNSMQIIEADVYPVRSLWLDGIYSMAAHSARYDPFWIKGSYYQGRDWDEHVSSRNWIEQNLNVWGEHQNGVALYTLDSEEFKLFIKQVQQHFPPSIDGKLSAYDFTISKERALQSCMHPSPKNSHDSMENGLACLAFRQQTASLFQYSKYVQMVGTSLYALETKDRILHEDVTTLLVHGK